MTIEERANAIAVGIYCGQNTERTHQLKEAAIAGATEQDKIARAEVYREIYAWLHYDYNFGRKKAADVVDDVKKFCFEHAMAMEGGKNEQSN